MAEAREAGLGPAIEAWCDHLCLERNLSPHTVRAYRGDVEALGARFAIPFYERCIARLRASESASARDLRDLSEQATEQCAALQAGVRKAWADRKYSLDELDGIEADALAGVAGLSAVLAEIARMRNALRAQEQGE